MADFMKYNLGSLDRDAIVTVTLSTSANVRVMQSHDLEAYKRGQPHRYIGGHVTRSPASFRIPSTGRWFVTIDLAGLRATSVRSGVSVTPPPNARTYLPAPSRDDGHYSQSRPEKDDYFVDRRGRPTSERPHVHVIHQRNENRIIIVGTRRDDTHSESHYLPYDASAREVQAVVKRLRRWLK